MAFDQTTRNRLQKFVSDARTLLVNEFTRQLQAEYGMDPANGEVSGLDRLTHLDDNRRETARLLRDTLEHYLAGNPTRNIKDCLDRIVREQAFTVLNRLSALRMAEARGILLESIADGYKSKGFQLYARLVGTALGETGDAYRCYLFSVFDEFALDLAVLFDRFSPHGRLFPREPALLELLDLINHPDIAPLWAEDETIGWIYQYFNSTEERRQMRAESQAPRNSRELAVRNQFFTPRYVVEFLTDNTLGRIWYEMTQGNTILKEQCRYLVRRPNEIFLAEGEEAPQQDEPPENLSQEELLKQPVYIPFRRLKDPREIRMLDPACGSMHFGLYAFDLFEKVYEESWEIEGQPEAGVFERCEKLKPLRETYGSKEALLQDVPRLIIEHNIHGIDIDPRAVQISGLSLWLRAQRSWQDQGVKPQERPRINKSNVVCAEPMPGDKEMLREFTTSIRPRVLGQLVEDIFDKMQLAGEAGSLLRIEEEIEGAVAEAREGFNKELLRRKDAEASLFPDLLPPRQISLYDFTDLPDKTRFWNEAEQKIFDALNDYAEKAEATGGIRKRLFARDTARGFAFIDICRQKYDVVLMNPPYGEFSAVTKNLLNSKYKKSKNDFYAAFIERGIGLMNNQSHLGAITSRTFLNISSLLGFREFLHRTTSFDTLIDLGFNVLDGAVVETCAYTLQKNGNHNRIWCIRLREFQEKDQPLLNCLQNNKTDKNIVFSPEQDSLAALPNKVIAYWLPADLLEIFKDFDTTENNGFKVKLGLQTGDNERFLRLRWEIPLEQLGYPKEWVPYAKGGDFSPFHDDIHLVINWAKDGFEIKQLAKSMYGSETRTVKCQEYYLRHGLTYPLVTVKGINVRILPRLCICDNGGPGVFASNINSLWQCLAIMNSRVFQVLLSCFTTSRHWQVGYVSKVPYPNDAVDVKDIAYNCFNFRKALDAYDETTAHFMSYPFLLGNLKHGTILACKLFEEFSLLDKKVTELYNLPHLKVYLDQEVGSLDLGHTVLKLKQGISDKDRISAIASYYFGCVFGRWDIRIVHEPLIAPKHPEPFDPLPVCSPGTLIGPDGLPARSGSIASCEWMRARPDTNTLPSCNAVKKPTIPDSEYPIRISWSGILVDDEGHPEDIVLRAREAIEVIWKDKAVDREQKACEILGISSLRDYFNKPGNFFADHLKRYSKSRRQAPIYWPISTASGAYTLWLYYHRLTDQSLYICVNDFVGPKLKQVAESAGRLRLKSRRSNAEEKELEHLSDLELELKEFRDELLRIAAFWKPNLNDGVQITAAPLWMFFRHTPWRKKLKETWQKLEKGDYDWAHLAYSIWPERVREKCKYDKSLAIAHDLEELYEEKPAGAKKKGGGRRRKK